MSKSVVIKQNQGYFSMLPIGSIIAWHRDLLGAEKRLIGLPPGWVECNGQKIDDPESLYHKLIIPNLNGDGRFLRGGEDSGVEQPDQMQNHTHIDRGHTHYRNPDKAPELAWRNIYPNGGWGVPGNKYDMLYNIVGVESSKAILGKPTAFSEGVPRIGSETRPVSMSVIWIMKIKQVTAVIPIPTILSHQDAPTGSLYINNEGNVGIGTDNPGAKLDVEGDIKVDDLLITSRHDPSDGGVEKIGIYEVVDNDTPIATYSPDTQKCYYGHNALVVTESGDVGIGTTDPSKILDVKASGDSEGIRLSHQDGYGPVAELLQVAGDGHLNLYTGQTTTEMRVHLSSHGDSWFMPTGDGNVGIGTTSPGAKLHAHSDSAAASLILSRSDATKNPYMRWLGGSPQKVAEIAFDGSLFQVEDGTGGPIDRIMLNGNVGIGTSRPSEKLDVAGNIKINGARTYLRGLDGAGHHWIMVGGKTEGIHNAIGFSNKRFFAGPGWVKSFLVNHPLDPEKKWLIHATLEGPEVAVFYRGKAKLSKGKFTVVLPDYFEALTRKRNRTVLITAKFAKTESVSMLAATDVKDGKFRVKMIDKNNPSQEFFWEVKAIRQDVKTLDIEEDKVSIGELN